VVAHLVTAMASAKVEELSVEATLTLSSGITIAGRQWGPTTAPRRVLCLHGWQDSAATWERLAPLLVI
jgi:alpha-beta hydrolase superfamily lysophospholipase